MDVSSPSAQSVDPAGIARFLDGLERDPRVEPHGLIIQRHGRRIAEGYWAPHTGDHRRLVYSLSKTFTGTALALQLGEGRLTLDDLVSDHLPALFDGADPATRRLQIRHIASMATGHDRETLAEALAIDPEDPVRGFLQIPLDAEPGSLFAYNQPPVLALATILQDLAGERLVDYLRPRVLDPLGITDLRWAQVRPGLDMGFSGVHTNLDAIARLGQLYLDDGVWDGHRLLPEGWVADASSVQIANPQREEPDWRQGYGFQLWMARHGYRGDGAFGQYMVVLPEHDTVVAMFSCIEDMQVVLDLMWEHLLPALAGAAAPPSASSPADEALAARLAGLTLPTAAERLGGGPPDVAATTFAPVATGPSHRTVTSIEVAGRRMVVHEGDESMEVPLTPGWTVAGPSLAASAATLDDGRLVVDLAFLAHPHRLEIDLDPSAGTFVARWPTVPLFGAGADRRLASMHPPTD
ncbi:MAG: serine hydrolase domain-containing protein [Ilumatobacteraceae bacterium]